MKLQKILYLVLAMSLVKIDFVLAQSTEIKVISVEELGELVKNKDKDAVRIIDVRTPEEVAEGRILNAQNIDYKNENFKKEIAKLDKNSTYLLYCKAGIRSADAALLMKEAGFTHIYSLEGGIDSWLEAGKPIEK
ncbi:rhodanese-related sulfurtransferase [Algoriphagus sp. 4150]|uniref:rhodanese-like domain-containing protein n=1 Tax=Algoriphagus sp. 4150 TaxID=2817756 RepID=UPI0028599E70|nr:rhodanese-like domain-containing protein [Algoriphagus sp. 4150]MDR7129193.1 rhodanese-related sulfurtransferase [Algoriphagus sp. 4150]